MSLLGALWGVLRWTRPKRSRAGTRQAHPTAPHHPHLRPRPRSIERSNLFEALCGLLSKTAFPVSGPLSAVHLQSLDGILAILATLSAGCAGVSDLGGWGRGHVKRAAGLLEGAGGESAGPAALPTAEGCPGA